MAGSNDSAASLSYVRMTSPSHACYLFAIHQAGGKAHHSLAMIIRSRLTLEHKTYSSSSSSMALFIRTVFDMTAMVINTAMPSSVADIGRVTNVVTSPWDRFIA